MVRRAGQEDEFYIESAATSREEIGNDTHPGTKGKLRENGIPFERHYARQVTKADYDKFDYLIGMDDANVRNIKGSAAVIRSTRSLSCWITPERTGALRIRGIREILMRLMMM